MKKLNPKVFISPEFVENIKDNINYKYTEENDFMRINWKNDFCNVYSYALAAILTSKDIPSTLLGTDEELVFRGKIYIPSYYDGFLKGRKYFIENFKNNQFQNRDTILESLDRYCNYEIIGGQIGWKGFIKGNFPHIISDDIINNWGFYNGVIYELKEFIKLNQEMFEGFYKLSDIKQITSQKTSQRPNRTDLALFIYYLSETHYRILKSPFPSESAWKELGLNYKKNWKNIQAMYLKIHNKRGERLTNRKKDNIQYLIDNMLSDYPRAFELAQAELNCI